MNDAEFLKAFDTCRMDSIDHQDHVRIAWIVLREKPLYEAIGWLAARFRRFAESKGKPEVYHETITWAFAVLINERIERCGKESRWPDFVAANPDLFRGRAMLDDFYRDGTLGTDLARRTFVLPDRIRM